MEDLTRRPQNRRAQRFKRAALSILLCAICAALILLFSRRGGAPAPFPFEAFAREEVSVARDRYQSDRDDQSLYRLILAHCREFSLQSGDCDAEELKACGRELYRRAKEGTLDLETIGDPEATAAALELLKSMGVTP